MATPFFLVSGAEEPWAIVILDPNEKVQSYCFRVRAPEAWPITAG